MKYAASILTILFVLGIIMTSGCTGINNPTPTATPQPSIPTSTASPTIQSVQNPAISSTPTPSMIPANKTDTGLDPSLADVTTESNDNLSEADIQAPTQDTNN